MTDTERMDWLDAHRNTEIINGKDGVGIYGPFNRSGDRQRVAWSGESIREAIDTAARRAPEPAVA